MTNQMRDVFQYADRKKAMMQFQIVLGMISKTTRHTSELQ